MSSKNPLESLSMYLSNVFFVKIISPFTVSPVNATRIEFFSGVTYVSSRGAGLKIITGISPLASILGRITVLGK